MCARPSLVATRSTPPIASWVRTSPQQDSISLVKCRSVAAFFIPTTIDPVRRADSPGSARRSFDRAALGVMDPRRPTANSTFDWELGVGNWEWLVVGRWNLGITQQAQSSEPSRPIY